MRNVPRIVCDRVIRAGLVIACVATFLGCSEKSAMVLSDSGTPQVLHTQAQKPKDLLLINSVLIAPPVAADATVASASVEKSIYSVMRDAATAELSLETKFVDAKPTLQVKALDSFALARNERSDAVLVTTIRKYQAREGSSIGASQNAEVNFDMELVRVSDRKTVWRGSYNFADRTMTENIMAIGDAVVAKGGSAGFSSADKLIDRGFREGLRDFNNKRTAQFTSGGK